MSVSTAIGRVSRALQCLLEDGMLPRTTVTLLGLDEPGGQRINLFLYRIQQSPCLRNADWRLRPDAPGQLAPPPLSLNLFYLMTAYAGNDTEDSTSTAHELLGEAMRVFHQHPVIPASAFADPDKIELGEDLQLMLRDLDAEELGHVWSAFSQPLRLSVLYEVSVVQLDPSADTWRPQAKPVRRTAVAPVRAPFAPPRIDRLEPARGTARTTVTFHGENLAGWHAWVKASGRQIAAELPPEGDKFAVRLPGDLPPGFHHLRIDVSHLFRGTFLFELLKPEIESHEPASGPAGTTVTFRSKHLDGWVIAVRLADAVVAEDLEPRDDTFQVEVPAELAAGPHELEVDFSEVFREVFPFEVVAP